VPESRAQRSPRDEADRLACRAPIAEGAYGGIAVVVASQGTQLTTRQASAATPPAAVPRKPPAPPTHHTKLTKLPHAVVSNGTAPIVVRLTGDLTAGSPRPTLSPEVAGKWKTVADEEVFKPVSTLEPCASYKLTIPGNTITKDHLRLAKRRVVALNVACPSTLALQQALARLNYIPYVFRSVYGIHFSRGPEARVLAARHAFRPPRGHLDAEAGDPPPLTPGSATDPVTVGALEIFQADHGLTPTGKADAPTWRKLLAAETQGRRNPSPYTWVSVSEASEILEVHQNHRVTLTSPANTGVAGAPTATGVYPIFARYTSTTMQGVNPDGSKYDDPGVPWVNYFNGGDAVHGFPRASYGSPQSDGCVELPIPTAAVVFTKLAIGDIVWVT
jgi:peptidoglycan hydrolase-like protein with peptidoglycan-binding domain